MVIYVYVQKQRNHLGLTPAIGASPNFSLPLEKFSGIPCTNWILAFVVYLKTNIHLHRFNDVLK